MYAIGYHGTQRCFKQFSLEHAWNECFYGRAIYISSSLDDVITNYHADGPDTSSKIEIFAEQHECTLAKARKLLKINKNYVLKCALTIKKPFMAMVGNYWFPDVKERQAIELCRELGRQGFEFDTDSFHEDITASLMDGISMERLSTKIREFGYNVNNYDIGNNYVVGDFMQSILQFFGFDGIIQDAAHYFPFMMRNVGDVNVKHYVLFNPKQAKIAKRVRMEQAYDLLL